MLLQYFFAYKQNVVHIRGRLWSNCILTVQLQYFFAYKQKVEYISEVDCDPTEHE